MEKSKARDVDALVGSSVDVGIWRPFKSTRLNSGPIPRTVIRCPSPSAPRPAVRSMDTPVMRCSDSARFVSGNLPMSSATIASTTPSDVRFTSAAAVRLRRTPVVTISSMTSSCASAGGIAVALSASATPAARGVFLKLAFFIWSPPARNWTDSLFLYNISGDFPENVFSRVT